MYKPIFTILREYREENNMTLRDLEKKINYRYSYSHLAKVEQNDFHTVITKKFLQVIAEELHISMYYLLTTNFSVDKVVNLDSYPAVDYNLTYPDLKKLLIDYRIFATNNYQIYKEDHSKFISDTGNIDNLINDLSKRTNIEPERLKMIIVSIEPVTLDEAEQICLALKKPFYELFFVHGLSMYDKNDVNVAMTIYKFMERNKNKKLNESTNNNYLNSINDDEEMFLVACLQLYRNLGLKSQKMLTSDFTKL